MLWNFWSGILSYFFFRNNNNRQLQVVWDRKSSQEYPTNAVLPWGSILGPAPFLLYINDLPDDVICDTAIYADDTTFYSKYDKASDLWQQLELASELESDLWDTGAGSSLLISMLERLYCFHLTSLMTLVLLIWKRMSLFLRKNHLLRWLGWLFLLNWNGALHYLFC